MQRLGHDFRKCLDTWARKCVFELDLQTPGDGWSPPDAEIMTTRREIERLNGPGGLKALQEIHPDIVEPSPPELRQDVPALGPGRADSEFQDWGLGKYIDMVEGRAAGPEPEDDGPSFGPLR